jgi:hypothetical protein
MKYTLCKLWAYTKYYFVKSNLKYDGMKEPWRFLAALTLCAPWIMTLTGEIGSLRVIFGIAWLLLLVIYRLLWHAWVKENVGNE